MMVSGVDRQELPATPPVYTGVAITWTYQLLGLQFNQFNEAS